MAEGTTNTPLYQFLNVVLPFVVMLGVLYRKTKIPSHLVSVFMYSVVVTFFYTLLFWLGGLKEVINNVFGASVMTVVIVSFCITVWFMFNQDEELLLDTENVVLRFGTLSLVVTVVTTVFVLVIMKKTSLVHKDIEHILRFWIVPMILFGGSSFVVFKGIWSMNGIDHTDYSSLEWFFMEMIKTWVGYGLVSQYMFVVAPERT